MSLRILPPANSQERLARQRGLGSLRQQGLEVRAFAQFFWTMSRGLEYQDAALKDIFNLCLDNPLPPWEMEQLRILDFWNFSNYVHHRKDWQILSPPESTSTDQPTVTPSPNQDHVPLIPPTLKRRLRRRRASRNAVAITVSAESTAVTAEVGKSELVENATVTPESVESVPVIPKPAIPEAAPVREHTESAPEPTPLREPTELAPPREPTESTPEPAPPREPTESAPEPAPPREPTESAPEPAPPREPTEPAAEPAPPREPDPVREPAPVWLPTELVLASHVMPTESSPASRTMPTEIIPELLVLPVMASAAILKQSAVIVPSMDNTEAVPKQPAFTATGSKSAPDFRLSLWVRISPRPNSTLKIQPRVVSYRRLCSSPKVLGVYSRVHFRASPRTAWKHPRVRFRASPSPEAECIPESEPEAARMYPRATPIGVTHFLC